MSFGDLGLNKELTDRLASSGIMEPTDVQKQAVPTLLTGKDGVIVSPTGTGKTLAYLLPILQKIDGTKRETQAVVLAPTQELAMQIMREAETYGAPLGIKATALIGGASLARQLERMKSHPALVVGTPGRVREVASTRKLSLHTVTNVVIDETDRIFSLGGRNDVENLLRKCSRERQTVFVSATRSDAMKDAESKWLNDPWVADVSGEEAGSGLSPTLQHWYFLTDRREKIDLVRRMIRQMKPSAALLFVNDTEKIGELLAKLRYEGFSVDALYGDTPGRERGQVLQRFRKGRTSILIATDVAARGLDIPGLPVIIQFEPALDADHYVHRAGRTARMGREGTSITLVTHQERFIIDKLEKQLKINILPKALYEGRIVSPEEMLERRPPRQAKPTLENGTAAAKPAQSSEQRSVKQKQAAKALTSVSPAKKAANPPKVKQDRARDRKNKGAPRWLKEKRETPPTDKP